MCDDERGAILRELCQGCLDQLFRVRIKRTRGFIEEQDRRVLENCASERQAPQDIGAGLAFAAGTAQEL